MQCDAVAFQHRDQTGCVDEIAPRFRCKEQSIFLYKPLGPQQLHRQLLSLKCGEAVMNSPPLCRADLTIAPEHRAAAARCSCFAITVEFDLLMPSLVFPAQLLAGFIRMPRHQRSSKNCTSLARRHVLFRLDADTI